MLTTLIAAALVAQATHSSGTAWEPAESRTYGIHRHHAGWDVMFHGVVFGQLIYEPGFIHRTGGFDSTQASSINWGMLMARRQAGAGRVGVRAMLSAEPWTVTDCGYLNFFATGETCERDTIHDRQHPHDLFMELAAEYDRPLGDAWRWQIYGGLAGEPALGPPGFPHRLSSLDNPVAPIGHHWLDSTHITFGLFTAGVHSERWKLEASIFNGREPDEERYDLDLGALDSFSGRISWMPGRRLVFQVSAAHLAEAEPQFAPNPRTPIDRVTASATYHRPRRDGGIWATTIAFGLNGGDIVTPGAGVTHRYSSAGLLESTLLIADRHSIFGRLEIVGKPGHDLHAHAVPTQILPVAKLQAGYARHLLSGRLGVGGSASLSVVPAEMEARYYGRVAPGFNVFVVLRPPRHAM